jgi:hypothetical protein
MVLGMPPRAAEYLRPRDQVFNMRYQEPSSARPVEFDGQSFTEQEALGNALVGKYKLRNRERDHQLQHVSSIAMRSWRAA